MRYHLTPDINSFPLTKWFKSLRDCLEEGSVDPDLADLIVVGFDTAKEKNWPNYLKMKDCYLREKPFNQKLAIEAIKNIQKEHQGRRVLLFNMSIAQNNYGSILREATYSPVTVVGLFNKKNITSQDISFPPDGFVVCTPKQRINRDRNLLLSFKGRRSCVLRQKMLRLAKERDVFYKLAPKSDVVEIGKQNNYTEEYRYLNANSIFGLVIRGDMFWAYRLLEVMSAGAIPVIISDEWVLPFSEILDWSEFSFSYPESEWRNIPSDLRSISSSKIDKMHQRLVEVYEKNFETLKLRFDTVLQIIKSRS